jgi:uncharacterized membrane protein
VHLLGAIFAVLSAATFALTNATGRRGVITGTPAQGMVTSIPIGLLCFLAVAFATGALAGLNRITAATLASLSAAGVIHFVIGRYCNFRASQAAGVNLTAPVMQLNAVVTLILAVVVLREPCTILQVAGGVLMVAGSLVTQRATQPSAEKKHGSAESFSPRVATGFFFASMAALMYGTSPVIIRQALYDAGPLGGVVGGPDRLRRSNLRSRARALHSLLATQCDAGQSRKRPLVRLLGRFRGRGPGLPLLGPRPGPDHARRSPAAALFGLPVPLRVPLQPAS